MKRIVTLVICITLALAGAAAAKSEAPAVAQPIVELGGLRSSGGTAFFIRVDNEVGYAAVGTAHAFELSLLADAEAIDFVLGQTGPRVATSRGLLVPPGRAFTAPGALLRDDFNVYALEARPEGVRVLELSSREDLTLGTRVQILGIPKGGESEQAEVFGRIAELSRAHIDVDLDVPVDLRGWGGAPVLDPKAAQVLGILEASSSGGDVARVSIAPIDGVRTAIAKLLDDGAGRPFAGFAQTSERRAAPAPPGDERLRAHDRPPAMTGPILTQTSDNGTQIQIQIDHPQDGAVIADSICGAFVAGRAVAHRGQMRHFDVVLVIDTSRSTADPSGADINGNGIVGEPLLGKIGSMFNVGSTDPGDSILAAEVAAARKLMRGLDPRATRIAVVRFSGEPPGSGGGIFSRGPGRPAVTLQPLSNDYSRVEIALQNILLDEPEGSTHIAAGVDQATIELAGLPGALSTKDPNSEKIVFFFTDGQATLPYGPSFEADNVRAVLRAAGRANRMKIRIHSFAIGPDALAGPIASVEMASRTNGFFTPVRHPGDLVDVVEEVSFANLGDVRVRNATTDVEADPFRTTADGTWGGFLKLEPGMNEIEITASADDGSQSQALLAVEFQPEAPEDPEASVPRDLMSQRNLLLEDCLVAMKQVRMKAEDERNRQIRRELKMEIDRERQKARERAAEQRKQLELGIEEDEELSPEP